MERSELRVMDVVDLFSEMLKKQSGITLTRAIDLNRYNEVAAPLGAGIPNLGLQQGSNATVVIIGCTRDLWPAFLKACAQNPAYLTKDNPLDTFVFDAVTSAAEVAFSSRGIACRCYFAHLQYPDLSGDSKYIAIQRAAAAAGMAYLDGTTHLAIHPTYGQWFSLRAMVQVDRLLRNPEPVEPVSCPISDAKKAQLKEMFSSAVGSGDHVTKLRWQKMVEVREAVLPDHPKKYSEEQILYHYTGDKELLARVVDAWRGSEENGAAGGKEAEDGEQQRLGQQQQRDESTQATGAHVGT